MTADKGIFDLADRLVDAVLATVGTNDPSIEQRAAIVSACLYVAASASIGILEVDEFASNCAKAWDCAVSKLQDEAVGNA